MMGVKELRMNAKKIVVTRYLFFWVLVMTNNFVGE